MKAPGINIIVLLISTAEAKSEQKSVCQLFEGAHRFSATVCS